MSNKTSSIVVVGLAGNAGSGKDTIAHGIMESLHSVPAFSGCTKVISPFAFHIREMISGVSKYITANNELPDVLLEQVAEVPLDILETAKTIHMKDVVGDRGTKELPLLDTPSSSPRVMMQTLGTEWGRNIVAEDIWVDVTKGSIKMARALADDGDTFIIVMPDVRFDNEAKLIHDLGGTVYSIDRAQGELPLVANHTSEEGVSKDLVHMSVTVEEDVGDGEAIRSAVATIVNDLRPSIAFMAGVDLPEA